MEVLQARFCRVFCFYHRPIDICPGTAQLDAARKAQLDAARKAQLGAARKAQLGAARTAQLGATSRPNSVPPVKPNMSRES